MTVFELIEKLSLLPVLADVQVRVLQDDTGNRVLRQIDLVAVKGEQIDWIYSWDMDVERDTDG